MVDGQVVSDEDGIRSAFADFFKDLAIPPHEEDPKEKLVLICMRILCRIHENPIQITPDMLDKAIHALSRGKAPDKHGLCAEQLLMMSPKAKKELTAIFNKIFAEKKVPLEIKESYKLPLPKKGKDPKLTCK